MFSNIVLNFRSSIKIHKRFFRHKKEPSCNTWRIKGFLCSKIYFCFQLTTKVRNRIKDKATWNPSKVKFPMLGKYLYKKLQYIKALQSPKQGNLWTPLHMTQSKVAPFTLLDPTVQKDHNCSRKSPAVWPLPACKPSKGRRWQAKWISPESGSQTHYI